MPRLHNPPLEIMDRAVRAAMNSPCMSKRGSVAYTVRSDNNYLVKGIGYNHRPDRKCTQDETCKKTCYYSACHAEQAAMLDAAYDIERTKRSGWKDEKLYCLHIKIDIHGVMQFSGPPACSQCSKMLLQAGYDGVYLLHTIGWTLYDASEFHELSLKNDRHIPLDSSSA